MWLIKRLFCFVLFDGRDGYYYPVKIEYSGNQPHVVVHWTSFKVMSDIPESIFAIPPTYAIISNHRKVKCDFLFHMNVHTCMYSLIDPCVGQCGTVWDGYAGGIAHLDVKDIQAERWKHLLKELSLEDCGNKCAHHLSEIVSFKSLLNVGQNKVAID
jgi:hypothetical protein